MSQKGFFINSELCTGCRTCTVACCDAKNLPVGLHIRRVTEYEGGTWKRERGGTWRQDVFAYYVSQGCNECTDPACVKVCPTGAHMKRQEDGLVIIDESKCIGCGACAKACPYGAPQLDVKARKMRKCDGCVERTSRGMQPVCVEACVQRAIEFGDIDELMRKHPGCEQHVAPLPDPSLTKPNLLIKPSRNARPVGSKEGTAHKF